jgi:hypothetical protein
MVKYSRRLLSAVCGLGLVPPAQAADKLTIGS